MRRIVFHKQTFVISESLVLNDPTSDFERSSCSPKSTALESRFLRVLCIVGGGLSVMLGILGFFLPVLPGTPFILLASFLLLKGSPQLHQRLRSSRLLGKMLRDWEERGGIRPKDKIRAIVIVIVGVTLTITFGGLSPTLKIVSLGFVLIGLWVILRLPMAKEIPSEQQREAESGVASSHPDSPRE